MEARARILVVDDDQLVRDVLAEALAEDFDVDIVDSGGKALASLRDADYAVMLADQRMPQVTGVELAALARKLQPSLVTIILSAYTDPKVMIAAINEGQIFRFVRKPWETNDLLHTLHQAVEHHDLGLENARLVADLERRLHAVEILQEVLGVMLTGEARHPMGPLLDRLHEVVPYDLAVMLLCDLDDEGGSLQLRSDAPVSEKNAAELHDQAFALFGHFARREIREERFRVHVDLSIDPDLAQTNIGSQVEVPLRLGDEVVGILLLQAYAGGAFPLDASRLLDQLANGTAEALARMRRAAGQQWGHLEQALAAIPDGVVLADDRGSIQMANLAARRLLAGGETPAGSIWGRIGVSPAQVLARGEPLVVPVGPEGVPVSLTAVTTDRLGAEPGGVLIVMRDLAGVEAAEARRRELVSVFSHEIRTPLSSVSAAIDLLLDGFVGDISEQQRTYLNMAARARDGLTRLVDQLLDIERYASGAVQHQPQMIPLVELARDTIEQYAASARERNLTLELDAEDGLAPLEADPQRLEQVLANLITNAIKFAESGSVVRVRLATSQRFGSWHIIGVESRGVGILQTDLDLIFDRFRQATRPPQRAASGSRSGGSGLGLAICRSIIEAHGGAIMAESDGAGATFWVGLPSVAAASGLAERCDGGPFWLLRRDAGDVDGIAGAAVLVAAGLWVRLAPTLAELVTEARDLVGTGIAVAIVEPVDSGIGDPVLDLCGVEGARLGEIAGALAVLAAHAGEPLALDPRERSEIGPLVVALGLVPQVVALGFVPQAGAAGQTVLELAEHVAAGEGSLSPVRTLVREVAARPVGQGYGLVRLDNLGTFRLAYGAAKATAIRDDLTEELRFGLASCGVGTGLLVELPEAVVLAAPARDVATVLDGLDRRFSAVARLHHRREDRERGRIHVGDESAPLVRAVAVQLPGDATESAVLAALATPAADADTG